MLAPRTADTTASYLRQQILSGQLVAGARLPPERSLAEQLGISRLTLRAALTRLVSEGLISPHQGSANTVLDWTRAGGIDLLQHLIEGGDRSIIPSLLQLRRCIAVDAAAIAAVEATQAQLEHLEVLATGLAHEDRPIELLEGNLAFSRAVLAISNNLAYRLLFNTVERIHRAQPTLLLALQQDAAAVRASFLPVVALIRTGDPHRVRTELRCAMEALDASTLRHLGLR